MILYYAALWIGRTLLKPRKKPLCISVDTFAAILTSTTRSLFAKTLRTRSTETFLSP